MNRKLTQNLQLALAVRRQHLLPRKNTNSAASLHASRQAGFTIIELMIATLIFSMILLLIIVGVIDFNEAYYKGVVQSNTQSVAQSVVSNISQAVQFTGGDVDTSLTATNGSQGICVGDVRYSYLIGYQLVTNITGSDQNTNALVSDSPGLCDGMSAQDLQKLPLAAGSTELLGDNMRLAKLTVTPVGSNGLYQIDVRVVYGNDNVLCSPQEVVNSCDVSAQSMPSGTDYEYPDLQCKSGISGTQFCAVSELSTIVQKRIN